LKIVEETSRGMEKKACEVLKVGGRKGSEFRRRRMGKIAKKKGCVLKGDVQAQSGKQGGQSETGETKRTIRGETEE